MFARHPYPPATVAGHTPHSTAGSARHGKPLAAALLLAMLVASSAHAHGDMEQLPSVPEGAPVREIKVWTSDAMRFIHTPITARQGEVLRFVVQNIGALKHEFSLGNPAAQLRHAEMMRQMPGMTHDDSPSAITLAPGETKQLDWPVTEAGPLVVACHLPGHFEAGMQTRIPINR